MADARAIITWATRYKFSLAECEELAKDLDAHNSMTFDLVGPKGRKPAKWLDAYYGFFQLDGAESFMAVSQLKYAVGLWCENLRWPGCPDAIATEAHRAATVEQGAVHEGAGPQDIAQGPSQ